MVGVVETQRATEPSKMLDMMEIIAYQIKALDWLRKFPSWFSHYHIKNNSTKL